MKQQRKSRWLHNHRIKFRDFFFITVGLGILWTQLPVDHHGPAQPLLIFLVIFLWAAAPLLRGDSKEGLNPIQKFALKIMGIDLEENQDGTKSSGNTRQQSESSASHSQSQSSPKS
jgi:hypothetical protein